VPVAAFGGVKERFLLMAPRGTLPTPPTRAPDFEDDVTPMAGRTDRQRHPGCRLHAYSPPRIAQAPNYSTFLMIDLFETGQPLGTYPKEPVVHGVRD
jgi:hypothetical protein